MRQLLLLRHAKAAPAGLTPDHSRPLLPAGRDAARRLRDVMVTLDLQVDLVLVSSARRTLQTLQALAPFVAPLAVELMDALYLASAQDMLHTLRQVTPTMHRALLIGHNPGLQDLAMLLAEPGLHRSTIPGAATLAADFPTAGLAEFDVPDNWGAIGPATGILRRVILPGSPPTPA